MLTILIILAILFAFFSLWLIVGSPSAKNALEVEIGKVNAERSKVWIFVAFLIILAAHWFVK